MTKEDEEILQSIANSKYIVVKTKSDLPQKLTKHFDNEVLVSTVSGEGIDELKEKIKNLLCLENVSSSSVIITNQRHKNALERASKSIEQAITSIKQNTLDLVAVDIKQAYLEIGEITGNTTSEEIIDAIFDKFCLGK